MLEEEPIKKKRKQYLQFLPVSSKTAAKLLKTEPVWEVLTKIREVGDRGIKADQIAKETDQPLSTVYGALGRLEAGVGKPFVKSEKERRVKKVGRSKKREKPQPGKSPNVYFEPCDLHPAFRQDPTYYPENPWGDVVFSTDFDQKVGKDIIEKMGWEEIEESILTFIEKIYKKVENLPEDKKISVLPSSKICKDCKRSHEGIEFIKANLFYIATSIMKGKKFEALLKKLNLGQ